MTVTLPPTIRWARAQRVKPASVLYVLKELATYGDLVSGENIFASVDTVATSTGLDRKTVKAAINRLLDDDVGLLIDTGLRTGKTGQIKVYRLAMAEAQRGPKPAPLPEPPTDDADDDILTIFDAASGPETDPLKTGRGPETDALEAGKGSTSGLEGDQKRATDLLSDPLSSATPRKRARETASKPKADRPKAKRVRTPPSRLPDDWTPPAIAELPDDLRACVETWPAGRYEKSAAEFRRYWTSPDAKNPMKRDWRLTWLNRIAAIDDRITERVTPPSAAAIAEVKARPGEGEFGVELRRRLLAEYGGGTYGSWFAPLTFAVDGATLVVAAASSVVADYVRANYAERLAVIASNVAQARLSVYVATGRPQPANREIARLAANAANHLKARSA